MELSTLVSLQSAQALVLTPIVIGLVGASKRAGLASKFAPFVAVAFGVGLAVALNAHWLVGLLAGLASSGLYDTGKSVSA